MPPNLLPFSSRGVFAVIIPSTNLAVEAEYQQLRVEDVSFHFSRFSLASSSNSAGALAHKEGLTGADQRDKIGNAITSVAATKPDVVVMGIERFQGGKRGVEEMERWIGNASGGWDVVTGASALNAALAKYGAKRVSVITPHPAETHAAVREYLTDMGYTVHTIQSLDCPTPESIAQVPAETLKAAFRSVNEVRGVEGAEVDALIQVGTGLYCGKVAAEMERELGKPVIAINVATLWWVYRRRGVQDQFEGWGGLFEKY